MNYTHFPAAALAAGLLFCTLFSGLTAYADDKKGELTQKQTETRQEYEAAQSALEELQNEQTQTESEVAALTGQAAELAGQITAVTDAVQNAQTVLDERQAAADAARAALDAKQAEYDTRLAVCREQLRAMQRLDGGGAVWLLAQAKSLYQLLTFDAVLQQMSARNSTVLAELDAEAAALEQARAAADEAARQAADAKAALEQQQAALADTQTALEAALLDANSTLTAQQAAAQAQAAVTDAAKKAYEDATAALDAYVREQSRRYTTADLHLTSLDFRCPLDSYGRITTQFAEPDPWGHPPPRHRFCRAGRHVHLCDCGRCRQRRADDEQLRKLRAGQPRHRGRRPPVRQPVRPHEQHRRGAGGRRPEGRPARVCGQHRQCLRRGRRVSSAPGAARGRQQSRPAGVCADALNTA